MIYRDNQKYEVVKIAKIEIRGLKLMGANHQMAFSSHTNGILQ